MYQATEYEVEILDGLKKLLEEKENELKELNEKESKLKNDIGYQIAHYNLNMKMYGATQNLKDQEKINIAVKALKDFKGNENYIKRSMHLPEEIRILKEMIDKMK